MWVGWNALAPGGAQWDDYPFIFLTLMLSLQASYAAPLILLAQNRQEQRDKVIAEQDRQANARAHADMEFLAREVASLRMAVGEVATRDYVRSELRSLLADLDDRVAEAVDRCGRRGVAASHDDARVTRPAPPRRLDSASIMSAPTREQVDAALATVQRPRDQASDHRARHGRHRRDRPTTAWSALTVLLTVAGCPLKDTITRDVNGALGRVEGVTDVDLTLGVMTAEQRSGLRETLQGGQAQREIPFSQPGNLTKVFAIASGKGGVGKSSVTVNLAAGDGQAGPQGRRRRRRRLRPLGARRCSASPTRAPPRSTT